MSIKTGVSHDNGNYCLFSAYYESRTLQSLSCMISFHLQCLSCNFQDTHYYAFGTWEEIEQFAQGETGSLWQDHIGYVWPRGYVYDFNSRFYTAPLKSSFTKWEI